jgi:hypothetical protein
MASVGIAKMDLDSISSFQEELHIPLKKKRINDEGEQEEGDEDEDLVSDFYQEFRKTSWYTHMPIQLDTEPGSEGYFRYQVNPTFDFLMYTYLRAKLPALRVKEKWKGRVQICWCHNVGINLVKEAWLMFDTKRAQWIDSVWFDIYSQWYMKPGFREHHNTNVGNLPFLEEWGNSLPGYTVNVQQPWYYCRDPLRAIPILFCSMIKITHQYRFRNKIGELLRMRYIPQDGRDWVQTKPKLNLIDGVGATEEIETPQLWGRYAYLNDKEREFQRECNSGQTFYIEDVIDADFHDPVIFGRTATANLDCKTPCTGIFFMAESRRTREINNHSNYTTDPYDLHKGWNPVGKVNLNYGGQARLKDMDSDHFSFSEPWKHFVSPPSEVGYHAYSFARDSSSLDASIGLVMNGMSVKLSVQIKDGDPYLIPVAVSNPNQDDLELDGILEDDSPPSSIDYRYNQVGDFILRIRLLVTRKMKFTLVDPEKHSFEVTIT